MGVMMAAALLNPRVVWTVATREVERGKMASFGLRVAVVVARGGVAAGGAEVVRVGRWTKETAGRAWARRRMWTVNQTRLGNG